MFKFTKYDEYGKVVHAHHVEHTTWGEAVELFQQFLVGCGYSFRPNFDMAAILEEAHFDTPSDKQSRLPFGLGDFT